MESFDVYYTSELSKCFRTHIVYLHFVALPLSPYYSGARENTTSLAV